MSGSFRISHVESGVPFVNISFSTYTRVYGYSGYRLIEDRSRGRSGFDIQSADTRNSPRAGMCGGIAYRPFQVAHPLPSAYRASVVGRTISPDAIANRRSASKSGTGSAICLPLAASWITIGF
jgi:hypothetical protein